MTKSQAETSPAAASSSGFTGFAYLPLVAPDTDVIEGVAGSSYSLDGCTYNEETNRFDLNDSGDYQIIITPSETLQNRLVGLNFWSDIPVRYTDLNVTVSVVNADNEGVSSYTALLASATPIGSTLSRINFQIIPVMTLMKNGESQTKPYFITVTTQSFNANIFAAFMVTQ